MEPVLSFVLLLSLLNNSLAAHVFVYDSFDYELMAKHRVRNTEPLAVSQLPWQFFYSVRFIRIKVGVIMKNLLPGLIRGNFVFSTGHETIEAKQDSGEIDNILFYSINDFVNSAEFKIRLNLYSSKGLCSSLLVAEGRVDLLGTKTHQYSNICAHGCTLVVDVSSECLDLPVNIKSETTTTLKPAVKHVTSYNVSDVRTLSYSIIETTNINVTTNVTDPPLDIESTTTTTLKPVVKYVTSNNVTDYVSTSPNSITETTTIKMTTNTNATTTDSIFTVIIISSTIGVVVVLILIIAVWKCWTKSSISDTQLINAPSDPFYLNMLFRRECDQEIAQIERHHYEEIEEHLNTENQYEEI